MKKGFQIKTIELKKRFGYLLLGAFAFFLAQPLKEWLDALPVNKWVVGIGGMLLTLYFFDFS